MSLQILPSFYNDGEPVIPGEVRSGTHRLLVTALIISVVSGFLVWGAAILMDTETLPIRSVRIKGEFRQLSPVTLQAIVTDVVRGGFFNVNVETIRETLLRNPWVYKVTVKRVWPDGLDVQVIEQTAIARWGDQGLINTEAEFFAPDQITFAGELPLLSGPDHTYLQLLGRYIEISESLARKELRVSGVILNDRRAWTFHLENGASVILGRNEVPERIERFARFVASGLRDRLSDIEIVDMRYPNGFTVQWRKRYSPDTSDSRQEHHG